MKKLILLFFLSLNCLGATPTLTNFFPRQFIVIATNTPTEVIRLKLDPGQFDTNADMVTIKSNLTEQSFYYTNDYFFYYTNFIYYTNNYIYSTNNYYTNEGDTFYITNTTYVYTGVTNNYTNTIIINNGTNTDITQLWTNELGNYRPYTLQSSLTMTGLVNKGTLSAGLVRYTMPTVVNTGEILTAVSVLPPGGLDPYYSAVLEWSGSLTNPITNIYVKNLTVRSNITINNYNIGTINPTDGYLPYRSGTNSFGDSWLVMNGDDIDMVGTNTAFNFNLRGGTNFLQLGLALTDGLLQGGDNLNVLNYNAHGLSISSSSILFLSNMVTVGSISANSGYDGSGTHVLTDDGTYKTLSGMGSTNYWKIVSDNLTPQSNTWPVLIESSILFGPGVTNALIRSSADLLYTNTADQTFFSVVNGSNLKSSLGLNSGGHTVIRSDASKVIYLLPNNATGAGLLVYNSEVDPTIDNTIAFGTSDLSYSDLWMANTNYIRGFRSSETNYSRVAFSHGGTNDTIHLTSQASGIAGDPRPFEINRNLFVPLPDGVTNVIDMFIPSDTNSVTSAMTFLHTTNGIVNKEATHVRWLPNGSGSDQTLTIPGWRTNVFSPVPSKLTNGTITVMYVKCWGATDSAALQTNCFVSFEYYK